MPLCDSSKIHEATDVNERVLFIDALHLGIDMDRITVQGLGRICDEKIREDKVPYPRKENFKTYNVYKGGKVLGAGVTDAVRHQLNKENPGAIVEPMLDEVAYKAARDARNHYHAMISQTFIWGMFYIESVLDNPKAKLAYNIASEMSRGDGYQAIANTFEELVELIN